MKSFKGKMAGLLSFLAVSCLTAVSAFAADPAPIALPTSVDLSPIITYGGVIVAALVGMIVLRKAIKTTNRS